MKSRERESLVFESSVHEGDHLLESGQVLGVGQRDAQLLLQLLLGLRDRLDFLLEQDAHRGEGFRLADCLRLCQTASHSGLHVSAGEVKRLVDNGGFLHQRLLASLNKLQLRMFHKCWVLQVQFFCYFVDVHVVID